MAIHNSPFQYSSGRNEFPLLDIDLASSNKDIVLVDVRQPFDYLTYHLTGSVNLPAQNFASKDYEVLRNKKICLICESGRIANRVAHKLDVLGYNEVYISSQHYGNLINRRNKTYASSTFWEIDRQLRFFLGIMLLVSISGYFWISPKFLIITFILSLGLTITSLINQCYLRELIARMPWNMHRV